MRQKRLLVRLCAIVTSAVVMVATAAAVRLAAAPAAPSSATVTSWDIFAATGGNADATQAITAIAADTQGAAGPVGGIWFGASAGPNSPVPRLGFLNPATDEFTQWTPAMGSETGGPTPALAINQRSVSFRGDVWMTVQGDPFVILKPAAPVTDPSATFVRYHASTTKPVTPTGVAVLSNGDAVAATSGSAYAAQLILVPRTAVAGTVTATVWNPTKKPVYVAVDSVDDIWFTTQDAYIARLTPSGPTVRYWPLPGNVYPTGITVSGSNVCVVSRANSSGLSDTGQLFCLDPSTDMLTEFLRPAVDGNPDGFSEAQQLAVNSAGEAFVTEKGANAVTFVGAAAAVATTSAPHLADTTPKSSHVSLRVDLLAAPASPMTAIAAAHRTNTTVCATIGPDGHSRFVLPNGPSGTYVQPVGITTVVAEGSPAQGTGTVFVADSFQGPPLSSQPGGRIDRLTLTSDPCAVSILVTPADDPSTAGVDESATTTSTVTIAAVEGDDVPAAQTFHVASSTGLPLRWTAAKAGSNDAWLTLTTSGSTLILAADHTKLEPGTYSTTVTISDTDSPATTTLAVALNVDRRPVQRVSPTSLTFSGTVGSQITKSIDITNTGGGTLQWTATMSTNLAQAAHLAASSGTLTSGQSTSVDVIVTDLKQLQDPGSITVTQIDGHGDPVGSSTLVTVFLTATNASSTTVTPSVVNVTAARGQAAPPAQAVVFENHIPGGVLWKFKSIPSWVTVTPSAARSQESELTPISIAVKPTLMTLGPQTATLLIVDQDGAHDDLPYGTVTINGTLVAPTIQAAPAAFTFTTNEGAVAGGQTLTVKNTGTGSLTFTPAVSTTGGGAWLAISPSTSTIIPAGGSSTFTVAAGTTTLSPGTYAGSITISELGAANNAVVVPVSLTVTAAGKITLSRGSVAFTADHGGATPLPEAVIIGNDGGAAYAYTAQVTSGSSWLSIASGGGGSVNPGGSATLSLAVNAADLAKGVYTGSVQVGAAGATSSPQTITVTLTVRQAVAGASAASLAFTASRGRNPSAQTITVTNSGDAPLNFAAAASSTGDWLTVSPTPGAVAPGGSAQLTVAIANASLGAGTYSGTITVTDPNAQNSPVTIPVTLTVTGAPTIGITPAALAFSAAQFGSDPAAQTFTVVNSGDAPLTFTPAVALANGSGWLTVTPSGEITVPAGSQVELTASVASNGLAAGTYVATIGVADATATNAPQTLAVTLTVAPASRIILSPSSLTFSSELGATPASGQSVTLMNDGGAPLNFSALSMASWLSVSPASGTVPAGGAVTLNVTVTSALAVGVHTGTITVGDPNAANSPQSIAVTVNVQDTTAPAAPVVVMPDVNGANVAAVPLSISGEAGSSVAYSITDGTATVHGTATIGSDGTLTITANLSSLADGPITVQATLRDASDNHSAPGADTSIKDAAPPAAPVLTLVNVTSANASAVPLTITGEAGATVHYTLTAGASTLSGTGTISPTGTLTVTVNLSTFPDGAITASATLTDTGGNVGAPGTASATKDATPPAAPTVTLPDFVASAASTVTLTIAGEPGATVNYTVAGGASSLSGSGVMPASGTFATTLNLSSFPEGTLTATATLTDAAGNVGATGTDTAVKSSDAIDGWMAGGGFIAAPGGKVMFAFQVRERAPQGERGSIIASFVGGIGHGFQWNRFVSRTVTSVAFSDDPAFTPGHRPLPTADTVLFKGVGDWNGQPGYTYEILTADRGEPGRGLDTFSIVIRNPQGAVVAGSAAPLAGGNIQSFRLAGRVPTPPDVTAPVLYLPGVITVDATGAAGARVTFRATARDDASGWVDVTCDPDSGSTFPIGTTTVECMAVDDAGNVGTGTFAVRVLDTEAPELHVPDNISITASSSWGAVVTYSAWAKDDISGIVPVSCVPSSGSLFQVGKTTVRCSASDAAGNTSTDTFTVTVKSKHR